MSDCILVRSKANKCCLHGKANEDPLQTNARPTPQLVESLSVTGITHDTALLSDRL
jgi:hypothetical protein